mgnify:CR=1 FL=1
MKIKGHSTEEKFRSVETALNRLSKKVSNKGSSVVYPLVPLSFYISELPEDGIVVRYMFPAQGTLTRVVMLAPELNVGKEKLSLEVFLFNEAGAMTQDFYVKSRYVEELIDHPVKTGDRMFLKADKVPIWVSLIYQVNPTGKELKNARVQEDTGIEPGPEAIPEGDQES